MALEQPEVGVDARDLLHPADVAHIRLQIRTVAGVKLVETRAVHFALVQVTIRVKRGKIRIVVLINGNRVDVNGIS